MNLEINHIFILCDNHDEVAQELIDLGFTESSGLYIQIKVQKMVSINVRKYLIQTQQHLT